MDADVLVIGAGQAAAQLVIALRKHGYDGSITVVGEEDHPPYQRPPLSKAYLKGEADAARLPFRPEAFYLDNDVHLCLGQRVARLDPAARTVTLESGDSFRFEHAVLATGSRPRPWPGFAEGLPGNAFLLRSIDDADALKGAMAAADRVVVLGGGYIGLEFAAVARRMGKTVTVLEREERLLARVTSPAVSTFYRNLHKDEGVDVRLSADVETIVQNPASGKVTGVALRDGETLDVDLLLVGIGGVPNDELAREAGIDCHPAGGILTGSHGETSAPNVFAAGDCARRKVEGFDEPIRIESVQNAIDQADRIAAKIAGRPAKPSDVPWFWSDQYDVKLQTVGLRQPSDTEVCRGDGNQTPMTIAYFREGRMVAADCIHDPAGFMAAKQIVKFGGGVSPEEVSDQSIGWKELMDRARGRAAS